jgi:hypothetical protein
VLWCLWFRECSRLTFPKTTIFFDFSYLPTIHRLTILLYSFLPVPNRLYQDHHTISGGWGPWETKFVVTGHEVIGKVVEIGSKVTKFQVGQRVGVGAQVGSCGECKACKSDNGETCTENVLGMKLMMLPQSNTAQTLSTDTTPYVS